MKKLISATLALLLTLLAAASLSACTDATASPTDTDHTAPFDPERPEPSVVLTFRDRTLTTSVQNSGVTAADSSFIISRAGVYELRGSLTDGQIKIAAGQSSDVTLILDGFSASCSTSAPLYVESANKVEIYLTAGSENTLTDTASYQFPSPLDDKPNACLYSADDLIIRGPGALTVVGSYNNGIGCRNDLCIRECTLTVSAPNNILKGNDSVEIEGATLTLSGGEDAIKADTTDRPDKGYILILPGTEISVQCTDDVMQATLAITVKKGAWITGTCGGDILNSPGIIQADPGSFRME